MKGAVRLGPHAVCQEHMPVEVHLEIARHLLCHADGRAQHLALNAKQPGIAAVVLADGPQQRLVDGAQVRGVSWISVCEVGIIVPMGCGCWSTVENRLRFCNSHLVLQVAELGCPPAIDVQGGL